MKFAAKLNRLTALLAFVGLIVTVLPTPVAAQPPSPPMMLDGFVYVDGVRAEDGTLVEVRIGGVTVASATTVTAEGQNGYYVLAFQGAPGDEVHLFVDGVEAKQSPVEYEMGSHTLHLGEPATYYTLTMAVIGGGQTDPPVGEHTYPEGSMVTIRAMADEGWQFDGWTGDVANPNAAVTWITMDGDKTVTANFTIAPTPTPTAIPSTPVPPSPTPTAPPYPPPGTPSPTPTATPLTPVLPTPTPTATPSTPLPPTPTPTATPTSAPRPSTPTPTAIPTSTPERAAPTPTPSPSLHPLERQGGPGGNPTLVIAIGLAFIAGIALLVLGRKLWLKAR